MTEKVKSRRRPKYKKGELVLSFSSWKTYKDCPAQYFKSRIAREKVPPEEYDITGTVPGTVVDSLAQYYFDRVERGYKPSTFMFDKDNKKFQEVFDHHIDKPGVHLHEESFAETVDEARDFIGELAENLADMIQAERLLEGQNFILAEKRSDFGKKESNPTEFGSWHTPLVINDWLSVSGAFDLYSAQERHIPGRLVDWKASRSRHYLDPQQLRLYTIALKRKWGIDVGMAGFILFRIQDKIWYNFTKTQLDETVDQFVSVAKKIDAEEFDYTPTEAACRLCDFRNVCEKSLYKDDEQTRAKKRKKKQLVQITTPAALLEEPEL